MSKKKQDSDVLALALALGAAHDPNVKVPSGYYAVPDAAVEQILSVFHHLDGETVHGCPPKGSGLTTCCSKTPFELPRTDRMTLNLATVTCGVLAPA